MLAQNNGSLYSIVLQLTPREEASVPATMGHYVHGAFLKTVRDADPELGNMLHAEGAPVRPFTVSPLRGVPPARNGRLILSPRRSYALRLTLLDSAIYETFMTRFLRNGFAPVIRVGRAHLLVREILSSPTSHSWANHTSWHALVTQAERKDRVRLAFATPTAFGFGQKSWGKKVMVLPLPETVFGSLARSWNALAAPELQIDRRALREYLDENVVIRRLDRLETQVLRYRRSLQVGFIGQVTYGLMGDDAQMIQRLNALADFAFYAGVGMKTTMGMGQCRRRPI